MTGRERVKAALEFRDFDRVPIELHDCVGAPVDYHWYTGNFGRAGDYTDAWGCVWRALEPGVTGEVVFHPLEDWSALDAFRPPLERIRRVDLDVVARTRDAHPDRFFYNAWEPVSPTLFERMQHLRGTEQLFLDLAERDARLFALRDRLQEYFLEQLERWCRTPVDAVHFADDWGSQQALLIHPELWRDFFKPMYRQYCELARAYGKYVIMHSDGYIAAILPDLVDLGVDAINSQLFCMPIEELAAAYHHRLAFWGEIDRQHVQVYGTPDEMAQACERIARAFFRYGPTGFVAQCYYTMGAPEANRRAEARAWEAISRRLPSYARP